MVSEYSALRIKVACQMKGSARLRLERVINIDA